MTRLVLWLLLALSSGCFAYETPDDCDLEDDGGEGAGVALICHLNAINSDLEKTNFSVIPAHGTRSLTVRCRQPDLLSTLEPEAFSSLGRDLLDLSLEGCNVATLPSGAFAGLRNLRQLRVVSARASLLAVERGALSGMPALERLELAGGGLVALPPRELCNLPQLRVLNVSDNEVASINHMLGSEEEEECLQRLEILDLSSNKITSLRADKSLGLLRELRELKLSSNSLLQLSTLPTMNSLQVLDLSDNQLTALPADAFKNVSTTLRALNLAQNSLVALEESAFDGLAALEILNLSANSLQSVVAKHLKDLNSLTELDLSANALRRIEPDLFASSSQNLEALLLDNNRLENLPFSPLPKLRVLRASNNQVHNVGEPMSFPQLTHLHLSGNGLRSVRNDAFANCTQILVLDLSHNDLIEAPVALASLSVLQTLDLSHNAIGDLKGASILDKTHLWRLQLSHNNLKNLTAGLLAKLNALQVLDVSSNDIATVDRGSFDENSLLQAIRLDGNKLSSMDGLFHNLPLLTWLNISDNQISEFDYAMVPRGLHWLDLSHNSVQKLGNYFDLTSEMSLEILDASFNQLEQLGPNSIPDGVETLLVNDNRIGQIVPYTFFKKTRLTKVDLTVNDLRTVDRNALRLSSEVTRLPDFYMGGNPIECDCHMVWFKSINSATTLQNYPLIQDIESLYCRLVYTREVSFIPLVEARAEQFLCPYETHCFALCKCCDFDACDCEMSCPDNCTCYHDNSWSKNIAVCSSQGFADLPEQLPMDATEIFLDGNDLTELDSHTFIGRKNLHVLHLNHSHISAIQNKTFNGLRSLSVLHLEGNQLSALRGFEFESLSGLRELYLQDNFISSIHSATFKALRSLEVLHLHGNRIIDFPVWQLAFNPFLVSVRLAENLWSCDCEFMERFRSWMSVYSSKIFDAESVSCVSNDSGMSDLRVADFDVSTCTGHNAINGAVATTRVQEANSATEEEFLPLLAAALASVALLLLLLLAAFVHRQTLRVWIHSRFGVRVFDSSFSHEDDLLEAGTLDSVASSASSGSVGGVQKLFDIFVSYSPKDEVFVREALAAELEQRGQYRLCLHHRDVASHAFVADTVVQATEASRRTLIVLSQNFLRSEWSRYDYKSGLHQALRSNGGEQQRRKAIVVTLGDISPNSRDLDPDLRLYLKTGLVLNWGDRLFWQKLRYALPDVPLTKLVAEKLKSASPPLQQPSAANNAEEHYYQQPRYATYVPPPAPPSSQRMPSSNVSASNHHVFLNNNSSLQRSLPLPPQHQQHYQQNLQQHIHHQYSCSDDGSGVVMMPSVPGQQVAGSSTVVMHI